MASKPPNKPINPNKPLDIQIAREDVMQEIHIIVMQENAKLLSLVRKLEWSDSTIMAKSGETVTLRSCHICDRLEKAGHTDDCLLLKAIR